VRNLGRHTNGFSKGWMRVDGFAANNGAGKIGSLIFTPSFPFLYRMETAHFFRPPQ
jgi:hypothetical protein